MLTLLVLLCSQSEALNITVSGFSSGGFFAHQFHVAYSGSVTGAGVVAGGPYYCAQGSVVRTQTACTINAYLLNLNTLTQYAVDAASSGFIDNIKDIANDRVFIFSGTLDSVVLPSVVQVTEQFYRTFIHNDYKIQTVYNIPSQHAWVTNMYGNPCWYQGFPGINNCGYDLAQAMLTQILGNLIPKTNQVPENLMPFDQALYADVWKAGLSARGFVYLPKYCVNTVCSVHVSFHGCYMYYDLLGNSFIKETGLNEWAESNDIIVIYPQTIAGTDNPEGCWDFWGYTGANYTYQNGLQMQAVYAMSQNPPYVTWA